MATGILDFLKRPRHADHPNRKASLRGRSQVYNILDNIIGFDDDRVTSGEALGASRWAGSAQGIIRRLSTSSSSASSMAIRRWPL